MVEAGIYVRVGHTNIESGLPCGPCDASTSACWD